MKQLIIIAFLAFAGTSVAQTALGEVIGEVLNEDGTGKYGVHVYMDDNGARYQVRTDVDGRFRISAVPTGRYLLYMRYDQDTLQPIIVDVPIDNFANIGTVTFIPNFIEKGPIVIKANNGGIKMIDGNLPIPTLTAEDIDVSPVKFDVKKLVTSMSSDVRQTSDGELVFRGARKGDMIYLIDGVKARDAGQIPSVSIGRMQLYTGGLPAKYGDTLGGVVVIESKSYFDLYRAWQAQQLKAGNN